MNYNFRAPQGAGRSGVILLSRKAAHTQGVFRARCVYLLLYLITLFFSPRAFDFVESLRKEKKKTADVCSCMVFAAACGHPYLKAKLARDSQLQRLGDVPRAERRVLVDVFARLVCTLHIYTLLEI